MNTATRKTRRLLPAIVRPAPPVAPVLPAGTRIRWDGDMANDPREGTTEGVEDWHMLIRWDRAPSKIDRVPCGLLDSPRWHILA